MGLANELVVDTRKAEDGRVISATLGVQDSGDLIVLGSSFSILGDTRGKSKSPVAMDLSQVGPRGVIALVYRRGDTCKPALIEVAPLDQEGQPSNRAVKTDRQFVCDPKRMGTVVECQDGQSGYALKVRTKDGDQDVIFMSDPYLPDAYYVDDNDLLCRFLVGTAELDELKAAAEKTKVTVSLREQLGTALREKDNALREKQRWIDKIKPLVEALYPSLWYRLFRWHPRLRRQKIKNIRDDLRRWLNPV